MNVVTRLILISAIIVAVTDALEFSIIKAHPERLTVSFVILVILVTVIPLAVNIWFHLR